jgi:hypothetical protein
VTLNWSGTEHLPLPSHRSLKFPACLPVYSGAIRFSHNRSFVNLLPSQIFRSFSPTALVQPASDNHFRWYIQSKQGRQFPLQQL